MKEIIFLQCGQKMALPKMASSTLKICSTGTGDGETEISRLG